MARGVEERLRYFRQHPPGRAGLCARSVWLAMDVPPLGAPSASAAVAKVRAAGKLHTGRAKDAPRGSVLLFTGGSHGYGHAMYSLGGGRALTTDPPGHPGGVGEVDADYPTRAWNHKYAGWTTWWGRDLPTSHQETKTVTAVIPKQQSLKDTSPDVFRSNRTIALDIKGQTRFKPGEEGWALLAGYANIHVPKSGTADRLAVARGGVRLWFRQASDTEADHWDETGLNGPIPIPTHGDHGMLYSVVWPHTVDDDVWQLALHVYAYNEDGSERDVSLRLDTREIKILSSI